MGSPLGRRALLRTGTGRPAPTVPSLEFISETEAPVLGE